MKLLARLTLRSLIQNRWRSLATMIAITLSTLMLVSVTTLASSTMDALKQREIDTGGNWHTLYQGVAGDKVAQIEADERTAASAVTQGVGYLQEETIHHNRRPYYYLTAVDAKGFSLRPYPLTEGRYPTSSREVLIPSSLAEIASFDRSVNDTLTANAGSRIDDASGDPLFQNASYDASGEHFEKGQERTFTIVGIYDDTYMSNNASAGFDLVCGLDAFTPDATYDIYVQDAQVDASLYAHAQQLCADSGCDSVTHNSYLLLYEGVAGDTGLVTMLKLLTVTVCTIVLISSIIVIHNSFAISLSQRARYLGMLASVGATRRQKQLSVFLEALFLAIPSILLGTAAALGATAFVMHLINALLQDLAIHLQLTLSVDPRLLAVTVLIAFAAVWISAWRPARHAGTISAISAIRQSADITLPQRHSRNNPLVWRLFGYPAVLGLKNQKRFRSRHYAVLCSLVLSFALFVSIFALSSYLERSVQMVGEQLPFDVEVVYDKGSAQQLQESDALLQLPQADARMRMQRISLSLDDAALFTDELIAWQQQQGSISLSAYVLSLDDASFSTLCRENGIDPSRSDAPIAFAVNVGSEQTSSAAHTYRQITFLKEDTHAVSLMNYDEQEISLSVAALLTTPYGLDAYGGSSLDSIAFYVSEATMTQICEQLELTPSVELFYTSSDTAALTDTIEQYVRQHPDMEPYISIQSIEEGISQTASLLLLVRLLLYAFLLLISIVALTNVCNTLSSSYALRAQENAMLFSIGMDKRQFRSMLTFEALSYAFKGAFYGLLLALPLCYLIYQILGMKFTFAFYVPLMPILIAIAALFLLTLFMLLYHLSLSRKENIIETIRQESI